MKRELRYLYRAFFEYRRGFLYVYIRFFVCPRILKVKKPIEKAETRSDLSVHMLFGHRDFLLALWSLASWYQQSRVHGSLYLHSDGTLSELEKETLRRLFPNARIIDAREILDEHRVFFDAHPDLGEFRTTYKKFQAKKLLDPYLSSDRPFRLVLDSDILWFQHPEEFEVALLQGLPQALMMSDASGTEGGFSYVTFKDGTRISDEIASYNSGITLYRKEQFNLDTFVSYLERVDYLHSKFTDQACYASIFHPNLSRLPEDRYLIKGTVTDKVVARHYTSPSRAKFYCYGLNFIWKEILCNLK